MPSSCLTLSGMNLPPKQCSPLQFSLHCLGKPSEIKYFGVNRPWMFPALASHPLGISTDSTFSSNPASSARKSRQGCRISPAKGKPKTASMIKARLERCQRKRASPGCDWKEAGPRAGMPLRVQSCRQLPFLPSSSRKTTRSTAQRIIRRCRAATRPSPPLLPGPTSTHTLWSSGGACGWSWLERRRWATCAMARPASSISVSEAKWYLSIRVSSSSLLSSLLPNVIFFIRYVIIIALQRFHQTNIRNNWRLLINYKMPSVIFKLKLRAIAIKFISYEQGRSDCPLDRRRVLQQARRSLVHQQATGHLPLGSAHPRLPRRRLRSALVLRLPPQWQ